MPVAPTATQHRVGEALPLSPSSCLLRALGGHILPAPLLAAPLAAVGLLDDRHNLPSSLRYGAQISTAALILGLSPLVKGFMPAFAAGNWLLLFALALLLIAFTAVINFINFMDGLDGLVGGSMAVAIAALSFSLAAPRPLILVGALLGFLLWVELRRSWGMSAAPFWVLCSLAWCFRRPVGPTRSVTSWLLPLSLEMLVYAYLAVC